MGFREYYAAFRAYSDIDSEEYRKRLDELEEPLTKILSRPGKVLDLGCGVGGFSFLLEDMGMEVIGLDSDEWMLGKAEEYAKERNSKVRFIKGDARSIPFNEATFDYVVFIEGLVHFTPPELGKVFKEIARVLKPGGKFVLQFTDLRELLPVILNGQVVGAEYWIEKAVPDRDERTVLITFRSEKDSFRVRLNVWGKTAVELLAKLYFRKVKEEKLNEHSYLQVYVPKK